MTRRKQYQGDMSAEWERYGPGVEAIAGSFVRGVNAWIDLAGERLPEAFALAGWRPEPWRSEDLLNRTDAFVESANARDEVLYARLAAAHGARRAEALLRAARPVELTVPSGLAVDATTYIVGDALRGVGPP